MINFDNLVLGPLMGVFGRDVTVTPTRSQPMTPAPYPARGVWSVRNLDTQLEDGSILSSVEYTLGIRLSDFPVVPIPEDQVLVDGMPYWIDDSDPDGEGGAVLTLKSAKDPRLP